MIPYKFFQLNMRDQTGILLSSIHRKEERTQNSLDFDDEVFQVPPEHGFLLSSYSIEAEGGNSTIIPKTVELQIKDAQGNTLSTLISSVSSVWNTSVSLSNQMAVTITGSPIAVIGPGLRIFGRAKFFTAFAGNRLSTSINGVLIPHGTMAYQQ